MSSFIYRKPHNRTFFCNVINEEETSRKTLFRAVMGFSLLTVALLRGVIVLLPYLKNICFSIILFLSVHLIGLFVGTKIQWIALIIIHLTLHLTNFYRLTQTASGA